MLTDKQFKSIREAAECYATKMGYEEEGEDFSQEVCRYIFEYDEYHVDLHTLWQVYFKRFLRKMPLHLVQSRAK